MIEERGEVTAVNPPYAMVVTQRSSSCGSCSTKGCGTRSLNALFPERSQEMKVLNPVEARVGDHVVLGLEEGALLRGSLAVYIVPMLTLIIGGVLGETLASALSFPHSSELLSLTAAFFGLMAGFFWVRRLGRRMSTDHRFMAVILRRAEELPLGNSPITWHGR